MTFSLQTWLDNQTEEGVLYSYQGKISSEIITSFVEKSEKKLAELETPNKTTKVIIHVLVEILQNLFHHSMPQNDNSKDIFTFCSLIKNENSFQIKSANFISFERLHVIKDRIDQINALSQEELKTLYKIILSNQEFSEKGGGGLGLIDLARKIGTKLEYEFLTVNENLYFYILKINIV